MKRLALHSIKAFNTEVKQNMRDPLDIDELENDKTASLSKEGDDDAGPPKKKKFKGKESAVKQTKIVRQAERVDPITGKGKSKGYGFVEMHKHSDALKFLRWVNNNREAGVLFSGSWWKEEVESLLKAEKTKDEKSRDEMRMKKLREEIESINGDGDGSKKKSKGTLIVEFSIENAQVVQRRTAKQKDNKTGVRVNSVLWNNLTESIQDVESPNKKRKRNSEIDDQDSTNAGRRPKKQRESPSKADESKADSETVSEKLKFTNPVGSIIGRKRKERRSRR